MKKVLLCLASLGIFSQANAGGYVKGGVQYLYVSDSDNKIVCQTQQLCDIALASGDNFQSWIFTRGDAWADSAKSKTMYIDTNGIVHVVLQSTDIDTNNPVILVGVNNQYHFMLNSVKSSKINKYAFVQKTTNTYDDSNAIVDNGVPLDFTGKKLNRNYSLSGDTDQNFAPIAVFNDGKTTYIEMSKTIDTGSLPTIYIYNKNGDLRQLDTARYRKPYFIVDGIYEKLALIVGSPANDDSARINVKYDNSQCGFKCWLTNQYAD